MRNLLDNVSIIAYIRGMTSKELKRWLKDQRATFEEGKGSHLKVYLNGRNSVLPMHGKDVSKGLENGIKKQLGLK